MAQEIVFLCFTADAHCSKKTGKEVPGASLVFVYFLVTE
jgi:hypothetical protein